MTAESEDEGQETTGDLDPYVDTADRLERNLDVQSNTLNEIDKKAEHVTRLLGILIGLVLSVVSIGLKLGVGENGDLPSVALQTFLGFTTGITFLVLSMAAAIVTYLSSKFKIGLNSTAGHLLQNPDYDIEMEQHVRRVIGTYAYNIDRNREVIEANSKRFRRTLVLLLLGVAYLAASGVLFVGFENEPAAWGVLVITTLASGILAWYILSGGYLTLEDENHGNER
jgi:hypothetical protein